MSTLYYFTSSYPYGLAANWKQAELEALKEHFTKIIVIPAYYGGNPVPREVPEGIEYQKPLIRVKHDNRTEYYYSRFRTLIKAIFCLAPCRYHMKGFITKKAYKKRVWLRKWLEDLLYARYYYQELNKRGILHDGDAVYYFFWGDGTANVVPYLDKEDKIIVRFHGGDLYREQNEGYLRTIPRMFVNVDAALFISQNSLNYAARHFPEHSKRMYVFRLGTYHRGFSIPSGDGCTRIISCSSILPVKRIPLLVEALALSRQDIEWTHIGAGPGYEQIKQMIPGLPGNVRAIMIGQVTPDEVMDYYIDREADLFINVSSSEGIPVSIMEAISAGIPIMATDVGGVSEIVDGRIGKLISPDITAAELANEIDGYAMLSEEDKMGYRRNAYQHFCDLYDAEINNKVLAKFIADISIS